MSDSIKTQGTGLYFPFDASVMKMACPTGITGIGAGTRAQINDTCLDELEEESFTAGLGTPGAMSVPFVFKPGEASQQALIDLKKSGEKISWVVGLSDGTVAPTLVVDVMTQPVATARTSVMFTAYVAEVTFDVATNEVVRGTLSLQRSGVDSWVFKETV